MKTPRAGFWRSAVLVLFLLASAVSAVALMRWSIWPERVPPSTHPARSAVAAVRTEPARPPLKAALPAAPAGQGASRARVSTAGSSKPARPALVETPAPAPSPNRWKVSLPLVSIVIDDVGGNDRDLDALKSLRGYPLTAAVLPFLPATARAAKELPASGFEVLLHLPMEPVDLPHQRPGPGAVYARMSPAAVQIAIRSCLLQVPGAVGVNNHMGSRACQQRDVMDAVMVELKGRSLIFLDSRTHPASVAFDAARENGLHAAARDVFLDNSAQETAIRRNLDSLVRIAHRKGRAVGIGHARPATLKVLRAWLPAAETDGRFRLVALSEVAE